MRHVNKDVIGDVEECGYYHNKLIIASFTQRPSFKFWVNADAKTIGSVVSEEFTKEFKQKVVIDEETLSLFLKGLRI